MESTLISKTLYMKLPVHSLLYIYIYNRQVIKKECEENHLHVVKKMFISGFIKTHRRIAEWEWYTDIPVKVLFIHLLIFANYEDKSWQGETIYRGQVVTSIAHLAKESGLSEKQVRCALEKLKTTGEISVSATNRYSKITITNYNYYQGADCEYDGKQTSAKITDSFAKKTHSSHSVGRTKGKQGATTKESKRIKENNISSTAAESDSSFGSAALQIDETADNTWSSLTEEERRLRLMF